MSRLSFDRLFARLEQFIETCDENMATRSSGSVISKKVKLKCTLRWLAGGSYLDICTFYGVDDSTFYIHDSHKSILWPVINAINVAVDIGLPTCTNELHEIARGFAKYTGGEMFGCVSAIDGWVCPIRQPSLKDVDDISAYRNRKGFWGIVVLAGCDSECRFNIFSPNYSGSTNDALAWDLCCAKKIVENDQWPDDFFLVGD